MHRLTALKQSHATHSQPLSSPHPPHPPLSPLTEALSEKMASTADKGKEKESPRATAMIVIGMAGSGKSESQRATLAGYETMSTGGHLPQVAVFV